MPSKAPTVCPKGGCPGLVRDGVCSVCGPLRKRRDVEVDERRGTAARRGYGGRWQRVREMYLASHPLCAECGRHGRTTLAVDVHHKIAKRNGGTDEEGNLEPLCHSCHSRITNAGG